MGASRSTIMSIFIAQGTMAGLLGVALGTVAGVAVAANLTGMIRLFESVLQLVTGSDQVLLIAFLRADLIWSDVVVIGIAALTISFLATLYPSWQASRLDPVEAIRYE